MGLVTTLLTGVTTGVNVVVTAVGSFLSGLL
jgi:hypothetical protein